MGNERNPWEILGTLRKVTVFGGFNEIFLFEENFRIFQTRIQQI